MKVTDSKTNQSYEINDDVAGFLRVSLKDAEADGAVFFARELDAMKARTYDVQYPELKFREMFPVSNEAGAGAETISYMSFDQTGIAEYIGAGASDLPRADIGGKETIIPVRNLGISVGYTTDEIRKSIRVGRSLDQRKMASAVRGNEVKMNQVAWFGDADKGHLGVFTHPNIPTAGAPNGGGGSPLWVNKTPDEILKDMNDACNDVFTVTKMVESVNTLALDPDNYALIATTARSTTSDLTILEYFKRNKPEVEVIPCNECSASVRAEFGLSSDNVLLAYNRSPEKISFEEPMPLIWHPEQRRGLEILVPAESSIGGFNAYYPMSLNIVTGI